MRNLKIFNLLVIIIIMYSCKQDEISLLDDELSNGVKPEISVEENTLQFESKETLVAFLEDTSDSEMKQKVLNFKEYGFLSLKPTIDEFDDKAVENYIANKKSRIAAKGYLYSSNKGKGKGKNVDLDDEIITDPKFASVLNEDREIFVEKKIYIYTTKGVFFAHKKKKKKLRKYLKKLEESENKTSQKQKSVPPCESFSISPTQGNISTIDEDISLFEPETCGGGGSGGSTGGTTTASTTPILIPGNFGSCSYSEDSVWQQVFGNRIKCNDYHDSKHRVQTQFWNENYFLWASIGTKVKYQSKKWWGGWTKSRTADFVELGVNSVKYTYNHVVNQIDPFSTQHISFKYKGVTYGLNGQPISFPANPSPWPYYNKDQTFFELEIFIDNIIKPIDININTDLGNVNDAIKSLLKEAAKSLPKALNLQNDVDNNKVRINVVKIFPNKTEMLVKNRIARDREVETYRFDFNFLLSYTGEDNLFKLFFDQFNAKKIRCSSS